MMNIQSENSPKMPLNGLGKASPVFTLIGDVGIDLVMGPLVQWPEVGTEALMPQSEMRAGGSAGNAALALCQMGASVRLISSIGNDMLGQWLKSCFEGILTDFTVAPTPTTVSVGLLHKGGERNFFTTNGHLGVQDWSASIQNLPPAFGGATVLLTGAFLTPELRKHYIPLLQHLSQLGYKIALDTGWPSEGWTHEVIAEVRAWLAYCDHVLLNELEITRLAETEDLTSAMHILKSWMHPGTSLIAKIGAKGAIGWQGEEKVAVSPPRLADIFDTVGAGDAFNAGYLYACARQLSLSDALQAGCQSAALVISYFPRLKNKGALWQTEG